MHARRHIIVVAATATKNDHHAWTTIKSWSNGVWFPHFQFKSKIYIPHHGQRQSLHFSFCYCYDYRCYGTKQRISSRCWAPSKWHWRQRFPWISSSKRWINTRHQTLIIWAISLQACYTHWALANYAILYLMSVEIWAISWISTPEKVSNAQLRTEMSSTVPQVAKLLMISLALSILSFGHLLSEASKTLLKRSMHKLPV